MFLKDWKKNGDLHLSPAATLWATAIRVLGCAFVLKVQIRTTAKNILKKDMKDHKFQRKSLTFDVACVPTTTKTGRFLTSKPAYQPFAKRQCVSKQFTREFQSFLEVTICGNNVGVLKYPHFVEHFRDMLTDIMLFEPCLVVIPYTNKDASNKGRPFANNCSMLSSSYCCQIYLESLWISDGRPTTVKIFVGHNMPPAAFNSKECAKIAYERDGAVRVCTIQNSKVVEAGYLQGSTKTINDDHWTDHFNVYSQFKRSDVQVKTKTIKDPTEKK